MKIIFLALASLTLLSCAAMQENYRKTCASKNWEQAGREDALAGKKMDSKEVAACMAEAQTPTSTVGFEKGYAEGLAQFCTSEYGLYFGRQGKAYNNTCPPKVANAFLASYSQGKMEYDQLQVSKQKVQAIQSFSSYRQPAMKCSFNSDCKIQSKCESPVNSVRARTCAGSNEACTFDSDCNLQGRCERSLCTWN